MGTLNACAKYVFLTTYINEISLLLFIFADINECLTNSGGCHSDATCTNTVGAHTCVCNNGFTGSGTTCSGRLWYCIILFHNISRPCFRRV